MFWTTFFVSRWCVLFVLWSQYLWSPGLRFGAPQFCHHLFMLSRCDSITQGLWTPGIVCDVARISRSHTLKGHKCWHKCQWLRWPGDSTKTARWWCSCLRVCGSQNYSIRIIKGKGSKEPGLWKWSKCLGTGRIFPLKIRGCIKYTGTSLLDEKSTSAQLVFCKFIILNEFLMQ